MVLPHSNNLYKTEHYVSIAIMFPFAYDVLDAVCDFLPVFLAG